MKPSLAGRRWCCSVRSAPWSRVLRRPALLCVTPCVRFLFGVVALLFPSRGMGLPYHEVVAGLSGRGGDANQLYDPMGLALAPNGDLIIADTENHRVQRCQVGVCWTVGGGNGKGDQRNQLSRPYAVAITRENTLFVTDTQNNRVLRWYPGEPFGVTVIGALYGDDANEGTRPPRASLNNPVGLWLDEVRGHLYVCDTGNHRVLRFILNATDGTVLGEAAAVAGVPHEAGADAAHLDNPTALFVDQATQEMYIADSRNHRVLRWKPFASEGAVELDNLEGRPYGVWLAGPDQGDALYVTVADSCYAYKRPPGLEPFALAGPLRCGSSDRQLKFPGAVIVTPDGAVLIADSRNSRVVRFGPEPTPVEIVCRISQQCSATVTDGNPNRRNLVAVVKSSEGSSCGGPCLRSGLMGDVLGGGSNWSDTARPSGHRFVRTMNYSFGKPMNGTLGEYLMCWGAITSPSALLLPGSNGSQGGADGQAEEQDCSSVPYELGKLKVAPYIDADLDGSRSQCVRGASCNIAIIGYALGAYIRVAAPPRERSDERVECGVTRQTAFVGYQETMTRNPAGVKHFKPGNATTGNLETTITVDFGVATGRGRLPLCLCELGGGCIQPKLFSYPAGWMRIRGVVGDETFFCQLGTYCLVRLHGVFLKQTDIGIATDPRDSCGKKRNTKTNMTDYVTNPRAQVLSIERDPTGEGEDDVIATLDFGYVLQDGRFQVCYCASYDMNDITQDSGEVQCDNPKEFTQRAGELKLQRVDTASYECAITQWCNVSITGVDLMNTDMVMVEFGDWDICGTTIPLESLLVAKGNVHLMEEDRGNATYQTSSFNIFTMPGIRQICYCPTLETGTFAGPCNDPEEFYQVLGPVVVRGPLNIGVECIAESACTAHVMGTALNKDDRLQICPIGTKCGGEEECEAVGPDAVGGLVAPDNVAPTGNVDNVASYFLGTFPIGPYTICYCSSGVSGTLAALPCQAPRDLIMLGGTLNVRGGFPNHRFSCVEGNSCTFTVRGYKLSKTDYILIAPLNGTCSHTEAVENGGFYPGPIRSAVRGTASNTWRNFNFTRTSVSGRFRVCYCASLSCLSSSMFDLDVGLIFVKGLFLQEGPYVCQFKGDCVVDVQGYGLRADDDAIQIIPAFMKCAGMQVQIEGDPNVTGRFNGLYTKGPGLVDGRAWYRMLVSRGLRGSTIYQYLFFDVYLRRWITAPELNPDISEEVGIAFAPGALAITPERNVEEGAWQVWDPYKWTSQPGSSPPVEGAWVQLPTLRVHGSSVPSGTFSENPTHNTTQRVHDTTLGDPYLLAERFHLGTAWRTGMYRVCWCPSSDLTDHDEVMCSADDEYSASAGILVVNVVRGNERYHCVEAVFCLIRTALTASPEETGEVSVALLRAGVPCHRFGEENPTGWFVTKQGMHRDGEAQFDLGPAWMMGEFEVCLCIANYQFSSGCTELNEFFQHAGTLTVASFTRLDFEFGDRAELSTFNLTRGSGLHPSDRLQFVLGDTCEYQVMDGIPSQPHEVGEGGTWAAYMLGAGGGNELMPGLYAACICAGWDSADNDSIPCSKATEFYSQVGSVAVTAVRQSRRVSSLFSELTLQVTLINKNATAAAGRLLNTMPVQGQVPVLSVLSRDFAFAEAIAGSLSRALAIVMRTTSPDAVVVAVTELAEFSYPSEPANLTVEMRAKLHISLVGDDEKHQTPLSVCDGRPLEGYCLYLEHTVENYTSRILAEFARQPLIHKNIGSVTATGLGGVTKPSYTVESPQFSCTRGSVCQPSISGRFPVLGSSDAVLVLDGEKAACGPAPGWPAEGAASERGVDSFGVNPSTPAMQQSTALASNQTFSLGVPTRIGTFTLCYCLRDSGMPSSPDQQPCTLVRHFYQPAGVLTIRGPVGGQSISCISHAPCLPRITGMSLSVLDRVVIVPGARSGEKVCRDNLPIQGGFQHNPATAMLSSDKADGSLERTFNLGIVERVADFHICYCASGSLDLDCGTPTEFTAFAGVLKVRGVIRSDYVFTCVRAEMEEIQMAKWFLAVECILEVEGLDLRPGKDRLLVIPQKGPGCGDAYSYPKHFDPNPSVLRARTSIDGSSSVPTGYFAIGATKVGSYRVCYCAEDTLGLSGIAWQCDSYRGFRHQIGTLSVHGAFAGQLFACGLGEPSCTLEVKGDGLSLQDYIQLTSPTYICGDKPSGNSTIRWTPSQAANLSEHPQRTSFNLGNLESLVPLPTTGVNELGEIEPVTLRVCYCNNQNHNKNGSVCEHYKDFTHAAGLLNIAICPMAPKSNVFIPAVEDVFGDEGDPHIRLYASADCIEEAGGDDVAGSTYNDEATFTEARPPGLALDGPTHVNRSSVVSTWPERCDPGIRVGIPRMNMKSGAFVRVELLSDHAGPTWEIGTRRSPDLTLADGYRVRGQGSVADFFMQEIKCPSWEVQIVPYACSWHAAFWFGGQLHFVVITAAVCLFFQRQIRNARQWAKTVHFISHDTSQGAAAAIQEAKLAQDISCKRERDERIRNSAPADSFDQKMLALLAGRFFQLGLALARLTTVGVHVALVYVFAGDVSDFVILLVICVFGALGAQFALLGVGYGKRAIRKCLSPEAHMHGLAALARLHLDINLPFFARRHHCELWRAALVPLFGTVAIQVLVPVFTLLASMLPSRREVDNEYIKYVQDLLEPLPPKRQLRLKPGNEVEEAVLSTRSLEMKSTGSVGVILQGTLSAKDRIPSDLAVRASSASVCTPETCISSIPSKVDCEGDVQINSRCSCCPYGVVTVCTRIRRSVHQRILAMRWNLYVCSMRRSLAPKEVKQSQCVTATYKFLDATGWHVAVAAVHSSVENATGVSFACMQGHWSMLCALFGGFDLTAIHIFFVYGYSNRLPTDVLVLEVLAVISGIIHASHPGIVRAFLDYGREHLHNIESIGVAIAIATIVRFLITTPLVIGCPFYNWLFGVWSSSIMLVELPCVLLYARLRGRGAKLGTIGQDDSDNAPSKWSVTYWWKLWRWMRFTAKVKLRVFFSGPLQIPHPTSHKYLHPVLKPVRTVAKGTCHKEHLVHSMKETCHEEHLVHSMNRQTHEEEQKQIIHLRYMADEESRRTSLNLRAVQLARSMHFRLGSLQCKAAAIATVLPDAPFLMLVHWATIVTLNRLPSRDECFHMSSAKEVQEMYGSRAVIVAVIHRWYSPEDPDPTLVTARQLLVFAHWYRKRWGTDAELFFWIDCSCLPRLQVDKEEDIMWPTFEESRSASRRSLVSTLERSCSQQSLSMRVESLKLHTSRLSKRSASTLVALSEVEHHREELAHDICHERGQSMCASRGSSIRESGLMGEPPTATEESADAFLPLLFGACDAVLLCESEDSYSRAWVRLELSLAWAFAPSGRKVYVVDRKLGMPARGHNRPVFKFTDSQDQGPSLYEGNLRPSSSACSRPTWVTSTPLSKEPIMSSLVSSPTKADRLSTPAHMAASMTRETTHIAAPWSPSRISSPIRPCPTSPSSSATFGTYRSEGFGICATGLYQAQSRVQDHDVQDPNDKFRTGLGLPYRDRSRVARLAAICLDQPALFITGGFRRIPLKFDVSIMHTCRLEAMERSANLLSSVGSKRAWASIAEPSPEDSDTAEDGLDEPFSAKTTIGESWGHRSAEERPGSEKGKRRFVHLWPSCDWENRSDGLYYTKQAWGNGKEDYDSECKRARTCPAQAVASKPVKELSAKSFQKRYTRSPGALSKTTAMSANADVDVGASASLPDRLATAAAVLDRSPIKPVSTVSRPTSHAEELLRRAALAPNCATYGAMDWQAASISRTPTAGWRGG